MTHVTCRLTAKTRDQLRNPTLGNRVWTTFTFLRAFSCRPYVPQVLWASTRQHESPVPSQCKSRAHSVWMWALFTCLKIIVSNMDYGGVQLWCVCVWLQAKWWTERFRSPSRTRQYGSCRAAGLTTASQSATRNWPSPTTISDRSMSTSWL